MMKNIMFSEITKSAPGKQSKKALACKSVYKVSLMVLFEVVLVAGNLVEAPTSRAEGPTVSVTMFATPSKLMTEFDLEKDSTKNVGRINFGRRLADVKYVGAANSAETSPAGPITWLIAGSEANVGNDNTYKDTLVLYSEEPLMSCTSQDGSVDSRFVKFARNDYTRAVRDENSPSLPNDYRISNLKEQLEYIESEGTMYFTVAEFGLMKTSSVTTSEYGGPSALGKLGTFTTENVLYAPAGRREDVYGNSTIYVGEKTQWLQVPGEAWV